MKTFRRVKGGREEAGLTGRAIDSSIVAIVSAMGMPYIYVIEAIFGKGSAKRANYPDNRPKRVHYWLRNLPVAHEVQTPHRAGSLEEVPSRGRYVVLLEGGVWAAVVNGQPFGKYPRPVGTKVESMFLVRIPNLKYAHRQRSMWHNRRGGVR